MKYKILSFASATALVVGFAAFQAMAQTEAPPTKPIEQPKDIAFPGTLQITVDATDLDHKIFAVHEVVPVTKGGDLVLMLPKWLPGHHSPGTNIGKIADIYVKSEGRDIGWVRDVVDVNAFHINVPKGAKSVEVDFKFLSATTSGAGRTVMTADMLNVEWDSNSLYPAGYYASRIPVKATLKMPAGWGYATGLETDSKTDDTVNFKVTDYDTLVDSPIIAGHYFKTWDLEAPGDAPVRLNVMADSPDMLTTTDDVISIHKNLVKQAYALYGAHHYNHYDFLVSASDKLGGVGLEHHRSSEDGVFTKYLTDWKGSYIGRDLLAHEYTHSWNGKFRRGDDLWTPNFQVPMRDSLLWVYEGQTQYWGNVLAARSGLYSKTQALESLALVAASYDNLPGRKWRALEDTTNDPIISSRAPQNWRSMERSEDYYSEGQLIWLDADTLIRQKTNNAKSLDDFAKAFFGIKNGDWGVTTYNFDDVVATLNGVYPYDWATFLHTRLEGHGEANKGGAPLDGLVRGGYKLVYSETPSDFYKAGEARSKATGFTYSLGITVGRDGVISAVLWDSPAFKAGLAPGVTLIAVNGKALDPDQLKAVVTAAKSSKEPIELLIKADDDYKTIKIDYHGGLRYPKLERIEGTPALLDDILAEKK